MTSASILSARWHRLVQYRWTCDECGELHLCAVVKPRGSSVKLRLCESCYCDEFWRSRLPDSERRRPDASTLPTDDPGSDRAGRGDRVARPLADIAHWNPFARALGLRVRAPEQGASGEAS